MVSATDNPASKNPDVRDVQFDVAKAAAVAREIIRENVGNLNFTQFKLESVKQNGDNTKYIVIASVIPDLGQEREYYLIKVDVISGKVVPPVGKGKMNEKGELVLQKFNIDSKWLQ